MLHYANAGDIVYLMISISEKSVFFLYIEQNQVYCSINVQESSPFGDIFGPSETTSHIRKVKIGLKYRFYRLSIRSRLHAIKKCALQICRLLILLWSYKCRGHLEIRQSAMQFVFENMLDIFQNNLQDQFLFLEKISCKKWFK